MEGLEVLNTTNDNKWNIIVNCILWCALGPYVDDHSQE